VVGPSTSRFPPSERPEARPAPADRGFGLDNFEGIQDAWRNLIQGDGDQAVDRAEGWSFGRPSFQDVEFMT
jgi:hypothetical protein